MRHLAAASLALLAGPIGCAPPGPMPPAGGDWIAAGSTKEGKAFIDRNSYIRTSERIRFRGRIDLFRPAQGGAAHLDHLSEIDCARRTMRDIELIGRRADGSVVIGLAYRLDLAEAPIASGSTAEAAYRIVCPTTDR